MPKSDSSGAVEVCIQTSDAQLVRSALDVGVLQNLIHHAALAELLRRAVSSSTVRPR